MKNFMLGIVSCIVLYGCDARQTEDANASSDEFRSDYADQVNQKTFRELLPMAERGDARAQFALAVMYEEGNGVPLNASAALRWYRRAAKNGYGLAHMRLGYKYVWGADVAPDQNTAIEHFYQAGLTYLHSGDRNAMLSALNIINTLDPSNALKKKLLDQMEEAGCESWGSGSTPATTNGCAETFSSR